MTEEEVCEEKTDLLLDCLISIEILEEQPGRRRWAKRRSKRPMRRCVRREPAEQSNRVRRREVIGRCLEVQVDYLTTF